MNTDDMETNVAELENLLLVQGNYFENLMKLGLLLENCGQRKKAFEIYQKGIVEAEKAKTKLEYSMLGMLD